jgi:hypothetical protein
MRQGGSNVKATAHILRLRRGNRPAGGSGSHGRKESIDRSQATHLKTFIVLSVGDLEDG